LWRTPALLVLCFLLPVGVLIGAGNLAGRGAGDQVNYHEPVVRLWAAQFPRFTFGDYASATTPGYHVLLAAATRVLDAAGSRARLEALATRAPVFEGDIHNAYTRTEVRAGGPAPDSDASDRVLRALGALFSVGLLATLGVSVARTLAVRRAEGAAPEPVAPDVGFLSAPTWLLALALCLPLAASVYVIQAGAWLLPDNLAWWGVLGVLLIALRPRLDALTFALGGLVVLALVLVRQNHLWSAGVLWAAAWLTPVLPPRDGGAPGVPAAPWRSLGHHAGLLLSSPGKRARGLGLMLLATLPAFGAVAYFVHLWGGLIVPRYQWKYSGQISPATLAFFLTLVGIFGTFLVGWWWPALARAWRERPATLLLAVVLGGGAALVGATTYAGPPDGGRYSGLWNIVRTMDQRGLVIGGRTSPLILVGSVWGAVVLTALLLAARAREAWLVLIACCGFVTAQTLSPVLWQRYHEPFVLLVLALLCARAGHDPDPRSGRVGRLLARLRLLGPVGLAGGLALVAAVELSRHQRMTVFEPIETPRAAGSGTSAAPELRPGP
jgi:hypothetical protein